MVLFVCHTSCLPVENAGHRYPAPDHVTLVAKDLQALDFMSIPKNLIAALSQACLRKT